MNLTKVAVLCGGQSAEHEISVRSAKTIVSSLDPARYEVQVIYINQQGQWFWWKKESFLSAEIDALKSSSPDQQLTLLLGDEQDTWMLRHSAECFSSDVIFPILHGTYGEDGLMQGLLEMAHKPYVGSGVLSSAACMDKAITKQLSRDAGVLSCDWVIAYFNEPREAVHQRIKEHLGFPCFVKPARLGSSVGITKVKTEETLDAALELAFQYDDKLIIEEMVAGREIECAVLGNLKPKTTWPGELIVHHEFYSYEAKYLDPKGASIIIHADLEPKLAAEVQTCSIKVFKALECSGMARVDFFISPEHKVYFNEINTIPGFTSISMYPMMWSDSGIQLTELLTQLIDLAIEQYQRRSLLSHQFRSTSG